ncbi:MAG: glycosyltransferase family 9 protein [Williamsia sp.]|nr:glycosyltransferase family 9 protein [Williamsia sp.]
MIVNNHKKATFKDSIGINSVLFSFRLLNLLLRLLKGVLFRKCRNPSRILVFRTGSLGDSLCAIPTIAAIRKKYPEATIDILTNPGRSTLISIDQLLSPTVFNRVINYFELSRRQLVSMLRQNKYELVIELPQANAKFSQLVRNTLFFRLIAPCGWGWEMGKILFYRKVQERFIEYDTEVVRLANIAAKNGVPVDINYFPLNITEADRNYVVQKYQELGIRPERTVGIAIGANRPQNRWPLENVEKVVRFFTPEYDVVILGGKEDFEPASKLCVNASVFNLCGAFTPMQSAVAIQKCHVFLSNDTGPMHLSYAVGTPTVATFTSRDFIGTWFPPKSDKNIVFRSDDIPCSICLSEYCGNNICIQAIRPSLVSAAMARLIDNKRLN